MSLLDVFIFTGIVPSIIIYMIIGRVLINKSVLYSNERPPLEFLNIMLSLILGIFWFVTIPMLISTYIIYLVYSYLGKKVDYWQGKIEKFWEQNND